MSKAYDLLNSLAEEVNMAGTGDEEPHIVIGRDRYITVPESLKKIGVQFDHNVETVTFECPRYWDDIDLSKLAIYVNYMRTDAYTDSNICTNVKAIGNTMYFDWTITNTITEIQGTLTFLVCIKKTDSNGNEVNHWNSEMCTDMYISEGLECQPTVMREYPDLVTDLLTRMGSVEALATPEAMQSYTNTWLEANSDRVLLEIEDKGRKVLDTIPDEYETTYQMANEAYYTKGDAIVCTADGSTIALTDSSDDPMRGLRVLGGTSQVVTTGKNLLPYPYFEKTKTEKGVTFTDNGDGSISVAGISTGGVNFNFAYNLNLQAGDYIVSSIGEYTGGNLLVYDGSNKRLVVHITNGIGEAAFSLSDETMVAIYINTGDADTVFSGTVWPMLRYADVSDDAYEPYSGGVASPSPDWPQPLVNIGDKGNIGVTAAGKNLFDFNWFNDIEFTLRGGYYRSNCAVLPQGDYVWSCIDYSSTIKSISIRMTNDSGEEWFLVLIGGKNETVKISSKEPLYIEINYITKHFFNNSVLVGQIENGNVATTYEPYKGQSLTLQTPNGLLGIGDVKDEIDLERGVCVKRFKLMDGKNITWDINAYANTEANVTSNISDIVNLTNNDDDITRCMCNLLVGVCGKNRAMRNTLSVVSSKRLMMTIPYEVFGGKGETGTETYNKINTWWRSLDDVRIIYQLAEPTETPLTAEEIAAYRALHTNYPNTTIYNDDGAEMVAEYNADTKTYIDNKIASEVAKIMASMTTTE